MTSASGMTARPETGVRHGLYNRQIGRMIFASKFFA